MPEKNKLHPFWTLPWSSDTHRTSDHPNSCQHASERQWPPDTCRLPPDCHPDSLLLWDREGHLLRLTLIRPGLISSALSGSRHTPNTPSSRLTTSAFLHLGIQHPASLQGWQWTQHWGWSCKSELDAPFVLLQNPATPLPQYYSHPNFSSLSSISYTVCESKDLFTRHFSTLSLNVWRLTSLWWRDEKFPIIYY